MAQATRTVTDAVLPAPAARRAGSFVFVSSIYPVDGSGQAVRASSTSPFVGESDVGIQSRYVLETLRSTLAEAGSSLELVLKAEVYLADAADFYEFKLVWQEYFPDEPPARTTIVVGDEHIVPGCLLNLHAVALAADAPYEKRTIRTVEGAPDPHDAEHAAWAVAAGPFVFTSAFPATDFETGIPVGRRPGFPYYGSDAEAQATYLLDSFERVLAAAGSDLGQGLKCQFYETDLSNFHAIDAIWGERVGVPATRSSMACRGFVVPGALFSPNMVWLVPDEQHRKQETRAGIRWHPVDVRKVNFSPGILVGDWLFLAGQVPVPDFAKAEWAGPPAGLPNYWSEIELQTEFTMEMLSEQLTANGFGLEDVVDARIFLIDPRDDYRGFARAWRRIFEPVGALPSMSVIPSRQANGGTGIMFPGPRIEIDLTTRRSR